MQIFELYFNPKLGRHPPAALLTKGEAPDLIFESFCYEPENVYERRLGSLYMVGELKNTLPQNLKLISNLAGLIKSKFYAFPIISLDRSLGESLKRVNEFLTEEVKKENTSWLGNLSFVLISLKNFDLNFTKVGDLKILLFRGGQITDIGERLEFQEIEPYPLKVFQNIVSGKLTEGDLIFVSSKEVFDFFSKENLINEIAQIPIEKSFEKELKKILKLKEKLLLEISGICLLVFLKPEVLPKEEFVFKKKVSFFPLERLFKKFGKFPEKIKEKMSFGIFFAFARKTKEIVFSPFKKFSLLLSKIKSSLALRRKIILVLILIFLLALGFFIFKREEKKEIKKNEVKLEEIQKKINSAENFLIFKNEREANSLLIEAWQEILPLTKEEALKEKAESMKARIEESLFKLNKLEKISEPELVFEFRKEEIFPEKMVLLDKALYFFNSYNSWLYRFEGGEKFKIEAGEKFNLAIPFTEHSILFFFKPDKLISFEEGKFGEPIILKEPYSNFNFDDFTIFRKNLYFLDERAGEIVKYPPLIEGKDFPKLWLSPETKKIENPKSIAIDGSLYLLTKNEIHRYYGGKYQETLKLEIFPPPQNFDKIFTKENLNYLYLMESVQKRIIILDKSGRINSQFQSDQFDNLKDFAVSENGREIYLLNGQKIYQINL